MLRITFWSMGWSPLPALASSCLSAFAVLNMLSAGDLFKLVINSAIWDRSFESIEWSSTSTDSLVNTTIFTRHQWIRITTLLSIYRSTSERLAVKLPRVISSRHTVLLEHANVAIASSDIVDLRVSHEQVVEKVGSLHEARFLSSGHRYC